MCYGKYHHEISADHFTYYVNFLRRTDAALISTREGRNHATNRHNGDAVDLRHFDGHGLGQPIGIEVRGSRRIQRRSDRYRVTAQTGHDGLFNRLLLGLTTDNQQDQSYARAAPFRGDTCGNL